MKVGIAGVGGIGSNVAFNLVRSGCCRLKLVDMDRVESSNLNRQFYFADQLGHYKAEALRDNLLRIEPSARIDSLVLQLDTDNIVMSFTDCDLIVEGFDDEKTKKMLLESFAARNVPIISACGIAGFDLSGVRSRRIGNCEIIGDFTTDFKAAELYCPKIQMIAAMMADRVLQKIGGR
jgi:sulfur carrier protein ThiS adenylyltransferase